MVRNDQGPARSDNGSPVDASSLLKGVLARHRIRKPPQSLYKLGNYRDWPEFAPWWPARCVFSPKILDVRQLNARMIGRFRSPDISSIEKYATDSSSIGVNSNPGPHST